MFFLIKLKKYLTLLKKLLHLQKKSNETSYNLPELRA